MKSTKLKIVTPDNQPFQISDTITSAVETRGYAYENCKILTMIFKTEPSIVAELLPAPLICLDKEQMVIVSSVMNGKCPSGRQMPPYHEIVLGIPAMTDNIPGMYCVQLYLDQIHPGSQVYPTMAGQLIYGYPKRDAHIEMSFSDKVITLKANRYDQDIISASFSLGMDLPKPSEQVPVYQYGLKYIPSIEKDSLPDVVKLNRWTMKPGIPEVFKKANPLTPFDQIVLDTGKVIPVKEIVDVSYALTSFEFGYGEVVWDYIH
jgi:acetoacetate decarboxylase